ncbi:hypothetical protein [Emticicia sp. TH156]|uniref:hypothetical protein n=1 Tax=Emticicia sp. TH156 TaxID=2067454 RepID=UPI000C781A75|nr:hypothetical protein [Emticicia sp. TH156]PLK44323.1 hypothetical protein C0V77_11055 [Emticicia sp. TH156]
MEILILISIIVVIALIVFGIVASQQDKARKENIASHPALGSFTFHYGTSLNTSLGLDLTTRRFVLLQLIMSQKFTISLKLKVLSLLKDVSLRITGNPAPLTTTIQLLIAMIEIILA